MNRVFQFRALYLSLVAALLALAGCASNPVSEAETVEQTAYALYGTFVVFEEAGAELIRSPSVPTSAKRAIQRTDAVAKPIADEVIDLVLEVQEVRTAVLAGESTEERLATVTANLATWLPRLEAAVADLVTAVQAAK